MARTAAAFSVGSAPSAARPPVATCVVADRDPAVLETLVRALADSGLAVVGSAVEGEEALRFVLELRPDVAIVDARLPGRSGFDIGRRLQRDSVPTSLVLRSSAGEPAMVMEAVDLGARGYVLRDAAPEHQVRAIAAVAAGGTYFDGALVGALAAADAGGAAQLLTRREREILRLLADGFRMADIGKRLYLSPDTVKVHLTKAKRKLGARTTTEAVATAVRRSLIS